MVEFMKTKLTTVQIPEPTLERISTVLENLATENTGWRRYFRRWKISHEPLRTDAANILRDLHWMESRRQLIRDAREIEIHSSGPVRVG